MISDFNISKLLIIQPSIAQTNHQRHGKLQSNPQLCSSFLKPINYPVLCRLVERRSKSKIYYVWFHWTLPYTACKFLSHWSRCDDVTRVSNSYWSSEDLKDACDWSIASGWVRCSGERHRASETHETQNQDVKTSKSHNDIVRICI